MYDTFIGLFGAAAILYAAVTQFSTLAAITQMGSLQERDSSWAHFTRPAKKITHAVGEKIHRKITEVSSPAHNVEEAMHQVRLKDKIVYTLSVLNVMFTAYLVGVAPQYFYIWHTPKAILYVTHRWWTFKQQKQHYLLYDFCYWANFLSLVYVWILPDNELVFQILFMVSNGPLAWSVLAFSQSLIFHSAPHMTSVFIHTSPMMLTHAIRWYPSKFKACQDFPACETSPSTRPLTLVYNAIVYFYGWWVVLYYVWVYLVLGHRIKSRGYKTLFDRVISRGPTKFLVKISDKDLVQKAAYMLTHFVFATGTMLLATAYWRSWFTHVLFIFTIVAVSSWNASGFYFTVFLSRYEEEAKERAEAKFGHHHSHPTAQDTAVAANAKVESPSPTSAAESALKRETSQAGITKDASTTKTPDKKPKRQ